MRRYALAFSVAFVASCSGTSPTTVTPSSTPPTSSADGGAPTTPPPGASGDLGSGAGSDGAVTAGSDGGATSGSDGGTACTQTQPAPIVTAAAAPGALAVDDTDVYFMLQLEPQGASTLWRAPNGGGAAVEIGSTNDVGGTMLTVNATAIFTLDRDGQLLRWPKGGGAPLVMQARNNNVGVDCLADAFGYIFFCTNDAGFIQVVRTPEDGGGTPTVVTQTFLIADIAFDPAMYLWYDTPHGTFGGPATGGAGATISIARTSEDITSIAVDDAHVYVGGEKDILVAEKRDGASFTTFAGGLTSSPALIVRDGNLYALSGLANGVIRRYALDGSGATATLAAGDIGTMAIRGDYVYYTVPSRNAVYRVCK